MKNQLSVAVMAWQEEPFDVYTLYVIAPQSDGLGLHFWSSIWTSLILSVPILVSLGPSTNTPCPLLPINMALKRLLNTCP